MKDTIQLLRELNQLCLNLDSERRGYEAGLVYEAQQLIIMLKNALGKTCEAWRDQLLNEYEYASLPDVLLAGEQLAR